MFQITASHTEEVFTVARISGLAPVLESFHHGLTDQTRRDIAAVVDTASELEPGEILGDKHYASRALGVTVERVADESPSRDIATAKWESKRAAKLTFHTVTLEIFNFSATDFEYIVRTETVTVSVPGGKATKTTTETVESFGSMKRAAQAFDYALTAGKGPEESKLNY